MFAICLIVVLFILVSVVISILQHKMENEETNFYKERRDIYDDEDVARICGEACSKIAEEMKKVRRIAYLVLSGIVLVISVFNTVFITNEQEVAFTMTFGKPTMVEGAGLHFKFPFITSAEKYDATTKGMAIGYDPESNESISEESLMITSDFNFVNTDFYVEYRISNPIEYEFGSDDPEGILRNIAQASIRNTVGLYGVDAVITTGRAEIQAIVKEQIVQKLEEHSTGLSIVDVTIQDAEPPTVEVANAFKAVENDKQKAETAVNNAMKYEKEKMPNAEAEADQILKAAEASKTERINQASQEVAEFNALYSEYKKNPDTVKKQLYYSALQEILPDMEIIIGSDSKVIYVKNGQIASEEQ